MKLKTGTSLIGLMLAAGMAQAGTSSSIVWDDFDSDPNTELGGIAAHSQAIFSDPFSQGGTFALNTGIASTGDIGAIVFSSGIGTDMSASSSYGGAGTTPIWDFTALNADAFEIDFLLVDLDFDLELTLSNADGENATGTMTVLAGLDQTVSFSLAGLSASSGYDASQISSVNFEFYPRLGITTSLDFIATEIRLSTIPAPSSLAMLGLGGLAATRRRR